MNPVRNPQNGGIRGVLLLVLLLAAVAAVLVWNHYQAFASTPISGMQPDQRIIVERGNGVPQVLRKLRALGVLQGYDIEWRMLARQSGAAGHLQAGEYAVKPGMTPAQLLMDMRDGKVVSFRFTLVEGWNIRDLRRALAKAQPLVHTIDAMSDVQLMTSLGHAGQHPEGRFLPETYQYNTGERDIDVLKRAYAGMQKALDAAWSSRIENLPFKTPDEALALASIVEKETGFADDRAMIAGVFVRRLEKGMRLETDPSVIYGMGDRYAGNVTKADLQADTPYNTYKRIGLPPTPICMPGEAALRAVTQPAAGQALYFVASGDGTGRSLFADTYAQHQANVRAYLARYRAGNAKGPLTGTAPVEGDATTSTPTTTPAAPTAAPAPAPAP